MTGERGHNYVRLIFHNHVSTNRFFARAHREVRYRERFLTRVSVPARAADAELLKKNGALHMVSRFSFRRYDSMLFLTSPWIDL